MKITPDEIVFFAQVAGFMLDRLQGPDGARQKEQRGAGEAVRVRSSFDIPLDAQKKIIDELRRYVDVGSGVQFEISPGIIRGIEVRAGGMTLSLE